MKKNVGGYIIYEIPSVDIVPCAYLKIVGTVNLFKGRIRNFGGGNVESGGKPALRGCTVHIENTGDIVSVFIQQNERGFCLRIRMIHGRDGIRQGGSIYIDDKGVAHIPEMIDGEIITDRLRGAVCIRRARYGAFFICSQKDGIRQKCCGVRVFKVFQSYLEAGLGGVDAVYRAVVEVDALHMGNRQTLLCDLMAGENRDGALDIRRVQIGGHIAVVQ